jgi:hypothetical protein
MRDKDDLLSVAIIYRLYLYVKTKSSHNPSSLRQKLGRPYLDYTFSSPDGDVDLFIVEMLLNAEVRPNQPCPTNQSSVIDEELKIYWKVPERHWTPWTSALYSVLCLTYTVRGLRRPSGAFSNGFNK